MANNFLKIYRGLSIIPQTSTPSSPTDGDVYYNTSLAQFQFHQGGSWITLGTGSITGPGTTTTNAIATWSNTSGTSLANSLVTIDSNGQMSIQSGLIGLTIGADANATTRTNNTTKQGAVGTYHYTNASAPMAVFIAQSSSSANALYIGGGNSSFNAASNIYFYAGTGNNTLTGTQVATIDSAGLRIGTSGTLFSSAESLTNVYSTTSVSTTVRAGVSQALVNSTSAMNNSVIGFRAEANRQITSGSVSETGQVKAMYLDLVINAPSGQTYTNTGTVVAGIQVATLTNTNASTLAISHYVAQYIQTDSNATGTRKTALFIEGWSGATNNAFIADNSSYTGNYGLNISSLNKNFLGGQLGVYSGAPATSITYIGSGPSSPFSSSVLSGTTQEALRVEATSNASATARTIGLTVLSNSGALSYTTELVGIRIQSGTIGAGSTVGTQIGLAFQGLVAGATNNAYIADNEAFTGNWFINQSSTFPSYFNAAFSVAGNGSHFGLQVSSSNVVTISNNTDLGTHIINGNVAQTNSTAGVLTSYEIDNLSSTGNAGFVAVVGNATTSSKTAYFQSRNRDSGGISWFAGTLGDDNYSINTAASTSGRLLSISTVGTVILNGSTPNLRVGTTSAVNSTNEQVSVDYQVTAASTTDTSALTARQVISGNTAITSGQPGAVTGRFRRSITSNTTDTFGNVVGAANFLYDINPGTGATYTLANSASSPLSTIVAYMPANVGTGTSAVTFSTGLYIRGAAGTTGTRAAGIYFDSVSSGTNNAFIADNSSYTGNYFINSTVGNPSVHYGPIWIGSQSQTNAMLFIGTNGAGSALSGTTQVGIKQQALFGSGSTTAAYGFFTNLNFQNATFTVAKAAFISTEGGISTNGGTQTFTRLIQYLTAGDLTNGTNNAQIADNSSFTGNWFINSSSSNASLFNGGIQFNTSGGTATTLNYYEEGTFTANFNQNAGSGGSSTSYTASFVRIGKTVTLKFPSMSITTGGSADARISTAASTLPSRLIPSTNLDFVIGVNVAGSAVDTPGRFTVNTDGSMQIVRTISQTTNWGTSSASNGPHNTMSVTYTIQ